MKKLFLPLLVISFSSALTHSHASSTEFADIDTVEQFEEGEAKTAAISEPGTLIQGLSATALIDVQNDNLWAAAIHPKTGQIIAATGPKGKVLALEGSGNQRVLATLNEPEIYAIAISPKGEIFVGSSPKGKIYRISSSGEAEVYFEPKEENIWALAISPRGELFAATGNEGRIYRITAKEKGEIYYDADEPAFRSLAFDRDGSLLAGTSGKAQLYRINAQNVGVVLASTTQVEIPAITTSPDGTIFFAANENQRDTTSRPPKTSLPSPVPSESGDTPSPAVKVISSGPSHGEALRKGRTTIYRIRGNLFPQDLGSKSATTYSLAIQGDRLLVATGPEGYIFSIDSKGSWTRLGRLEADQVTALLQSNGPLYAITCNQSRLFKIDTKPATPAIYLSKIIDSKLFAKWGTLKVDGSGSWEIRTRSGNTSDPDKSWYPWIPLQNNRVNSQSGRYLQIEIALSDGNIQHLSLSYRTQNQPPIMRRIQVLDPGIGYRVMSKPPTPPGPANLESILRGGPSYEMKPSYQPESEPGLRTIAWLANDANNDELTFKVEIRQSSENSWTLLKDKLEVPVFSWDSSAWPEGKYYVRVTASDEKSNPPNEVLTAHAESELFVIDHTPPKITITQQSADSIQFTVADSISLLSDVSISTDGNIYYPLLPEDGILDEQTEQFKAARKPGTPLFIRAVDEVGNTGGVRVAP